MVAVHLLRQDSAVHIDLIDPRTAGRGLAYSTIWDDHLLNVPAIRMSAIGSEPTHFLDWLHVNGKPHAAPDYFAPRKLFGTYVQDLLQTSARNAHPQSRFRQHYSEAVSVAHDGLRARVLLKNGSVLDADKVVFAGGNPPSRAMANPLPGYFGSPWDKAAFGGLDPERDVLLIGAGLTAVDAFLALDSQEHHGRIHMVSRQGKLPHAHAFYRPLAETPVIPEGMSARELLHSIRRRVRHAEAQGTDWRAVIDSLRPITNDIWRGMELVEQRRALRNKTWWDIHRHRMAPEIGRKVAAAQKRGQLCVHAGRVANVEERNGGLSALVRLRKGGELRLDVQRTINCTGPDEDYRTNPNLFVASLRDTGRVSPNYIGKGVRTDAFGAMIDTDGVTTNWLLTLGPPRLGAMLESTAVPEVRKQAEALAGYLAARIFEPIETPMELYLAAGI